MKTFKFWKIQVNMTNRVFYTFVAIGIMILLGVMVYSYANPTTGVGHGPEEIGPGTFAGGGDYIFPGDSKVGIGTDSPGAKLQVIGSIKLSSDTPDCDSSNAGVMRWTGTDFEGCDGSAWASLTADVGAGEFDLIYGLHSSEQCDNLGGTVVLDGTDKFCRFSGSSCQPGWAQFKQWSTTSAESCSGKNYCAISSCSVLCCSSYYNRYRTCTTESHSWSDIEGVETCTYHHAKCSIPVDSSEDSWSCPISLTSATCSATKIQIGCY